MSRLKNRINFSVMVLTGLGLTISGIYFYANMQDFLDNSISANGIVIELQGNGLMAPVVKFTDANGQEQLFTSRHSSSPPKYQIDQRVQVVYINDRADEELEAYIYDRWQMFVRKYAVLLFGLMFLMLGVVFGRIFWNRESMHIGTGSRHSGPAFLESRRREARGEPAQDQ